MKVWEEWQKRTLVAEREIERLRKALQRIADPSRCEEDIAHCIASQALENK